MSHYKIDYTKLTDRQIVEKILAEPHDEEGAVYLLHDRYSPLLLSIYRSFTKDVTWYDDCVDELFIHLKGADCTWRSLANFKWRSTFGYWLRGVARNKFFELIPQLIENGGQNESLDNDDADKPKIQIPDEGEETFERQMRKVILMEAVSKLKDGDQQFVVLKRLQGYSSKEIAILLQMKWKKYGIVKYNKDKEIVVPDADYVNVRTQRAKENLKTIIVEL